MDHDHKTKRVRGLLCTKCNFAIELIAAGHLKRALRYLS